MQHLVECTDTRSYQIIPELVHEMRQWLLMQADSLRREASDHARAANGNGGMLCHLQYRQCMAAADSLMRLIDYADMPFAAHRWHNAEYVLTAYLHETGRHDECHDGIVDTDMGH